MTNPAERFETIEFLGQPTEHSVVVRGRDLRSGRQVAVKMARPGVRIQKRFDREVEAMRSATGPSVMPVLEVDDEGAWYTMPIATTELTEASAGLSQEEREQLAYETVRVVAAALREFHSKGQVHRDLKPQNILCLDNEGDPRWVVSDFGVARNIPGSTTSQLTQAGGLLGTEGWAAPELHHNAHAATAAADVYSLGAIVAWILTDDFPTSGSVTQPSGRFRSVVVKATRREPLQRYSSVDLMLTAMEKVRVGTGGPLSRQLDGLLAPPIDCDELSIFLITHKNNAELILPELPKMGDDLIASWFTADVDGLLQVGVRVSEMLQDEQDRAGLNQEGLRPPLRWILRVLGVFGANNLLTSAMPLAIGFFEALEACDQWPVSQDTASWFKSLSAEAAESMITAAEASTAESYLRYWLQDSWTQPKSHAVRRWMT